MLSGKYSDALSEVYAIDDFKIQATFFSVALVDSGLMPTRYQLIEYISNQRLNALTRSGKKAEELAKILEENCFDY